MVKAAAPMLMLLLVLLASSCVSQNEEADQMGGLRLSSPAFADGGGIPTKYTCQGENVSPPLAIDGVPAGARSLALIMEDPDAPMGTWDHWIMWNIPVAGSIREGSVPQGTVQGRNGWGSAEYGGPCPPSGRHRYVFSLFALNRTLDLAAGSPKARVLDAMKGSVLAQAKLMGLYQKK